MLNILISWLRDHSGWSSAAPHPQPSEPKAVNSGPPSRHARTPVFFFFFFCLTSSSPFPFFPPRFSPPAAGPQVLQRQASELSYMSPARQEKPGHLTWADTRSRRCLLGRRISVVSESSIRINRTSCPFKMCNCIPGILLDQQSRRRDNNSAGASPRRGNEEQLVTKYHTDNPFQIIFTLLSSSSRPQPK